MDKTLIDVDLLDYSKPQSYYIELWGIARTTLKRWFKELDIYHRFYFASGANTGVLKARQQQEQYDANPKHCAQCDKALSYKQRNNRFCDARCSQTHRYANDPSLRAKQGLEIKRRIAEGTWKKHGVYPNRVKVRIQTACKQCGKEMQLLPCQIKRGKPFCSRKCANDGHTGGGGYREGSGRGKSGWYKDIFCNSTWELAWVIYHLDHQKPFSRNSEGFEYTFAGEQHLYYPDFVMSDGSYVEIKGYSTQQWLAKQSQFSRPLRVFAKAEMEPILFYVKSVYGIDFVRLYEGNPHDRKLNKCELCGKPARNRFCSNVCSGKHLATLRGWDKSTLRPIGESAISGTLQVPVCGSAPQ